VKRPNNQKTRTVTLKGAAGGVWTIRVGKQVKNLKEVKKGGQVVLRVTEALALEGYQALIRSPNPTCTPDH